MDDDVDDRYAGIDIDSLLNRNDTRRGLSYGRKKAFYEAPEFLQRLNGEETLMEGQALCLECKVQGFPVPTLRWFKDDEQIIDHPRIKVQSDGKGAYALVIDNVMRGDEAAYRCRAENVEGACSSVFFLSVRAKPKSSKSSQKSPNRRTVSFPPMFSTIVEKVEEEEKQGKELEMLPPSPLTDFYYALTLKSRATWPAFLGDWAFKNGGRRGSDTEILPNGDVQEPQSPSEGRERARKNLRRSDLTARVQAKKQRLDEERKQREEEEREAAKKKKEEGESEEARMKREKEEKEKEEAKRRLEEKREEERKLETKLILEREERRRKRAELERESAEKEEAMRKRREARAERIERERREREEEEERERMQLEEEENRKRLDTQKKKSEDDIKRKEEERIKEVEHLEQNREEKEARRKELEETQKEEENKKKEEEERKKHIEEKRKEEEAKKKKEEARQKELEQKRKEEENKKKEEEEKRKQLEEKRKEEDRKKKEKEEEEKKKRLEKEKEDEERRKKEQEEKKKRLDHEKKEEERKRKEAEERKRKEEEERKRREEQEKQKRLDHEKKEEGRKRKEEEEKKKKNLSTALKRNENGVSEKRHSLFETNQKDAEEKPWSQRKGSKTEAETDSSQGLKPKPKAFQMFEEKTKAKSPPPLANKPKPNVLSRFQEKLESKTATATATEDSQGKPGKLKVPDSSAHDKMAAVDSKTDSDRGGHIRDRSPGNGPRSKFEPQTNNIPEKPVVKKTSPWQKGKEEVHNEPENLKDKTAANEPKWKQTIRLKREQEQAQEEAAKKQKAKAEEERRKLEEKKRVETKLKEETKRKEEEKIKEEKRKIEEKKRAEDKLKEETKRKEEEKRKMDEKKQAEEKLKAEAKKKEEEKRKIEEKKQSEAKLKESVKRKEEEKLKEEKKRLETKAKEEAKRKEEERIKEEKRKLAEKQHKQEEKQKQEAEEKQRKEADEQKKKEELIKADLIRKQAAQREMLQKKKDEEEAQKKAQKEKEEKEKMRLQFRKEQLRKEQLKRQKEEEVQRNQKKQREIEEKKRREQQNAGAQSAEENPDEVKVYKRDYSFSDLRKSLEATLTLGGASVLNAEEHKYWDDILEKHNYSIGDIKKTLDTFASGSATLDRPSRMRSRRNSIEDLEMVQMKRSSSIGDLRESYTKSLERPKSKKKASDPNKVKKDEEILKRKSSINDTRQQLLETVKRQLEPLTGGQSTKEADITIRSLKTKTSETPTARSPDGGMPASSPFPPLGAGSNPSALPGLNNLSISVKSKRASFHEMISQQGTETVTSLRIATSSVKADLNKRKSYHGHDAYGSREIPVYKRAVGWTDEIGKTRDTSSQPASAVSPTGNKGAASSTAPGSKTNTPPARPGKLSLPDKEDNAGARPFVFNSTRTIARRSTGSIPSDMSSEDDDDDSVFDEDGDEEVKDKVQSSLSDLGDPLKKTALFCFDEDGDITERVDAGQVKRKKDSARASSGYHTEEDPDHPGPRSKIPRKVVDDGENNREVCDLDRDGRGKEAPITVVATNKSAPSHVKHVDTITKSLNSEGDQTPPIVVELWDSTNPPCGENRSIVNGDRLNLVDQSPNFSREEREPTPFLPGPTRRPKGGDTSKPPPSPTGPYLAPPSQQPVKFEREGTPTPELGRKKYALLLNTEPRETFHREATPFFRDSDGKTQDSVTNNPQHMFLNVPQVGTALGLYKEGSASKHPKNVHTPEVKLNTPKLDQASEHAKLALPNASSEFNTASIASADITNSQKRLHDPSTTPAELGISSPDSTSMQKNEGNKTPRAAQNVNGFYPSNRQTSLGETSACDLQQKPDSARSTDEHGDPKCSRLLVTQPDPHQHSPKASSSVGLQVIVNKDTEEQAGRKAQTPSPSSIPKMKPQKAINQHSTNGAQSVSGEQGKSNVLTGRSTEKLSSSFMASDQLPVTSRNSDKDEEKKDPGNAKSVTQMSKSLSNETKSVPSGISKENTNSSITQGEPSSLISQQDANSSLTPNTRSNGAATKSVLDSSPTHVKSTPSASATPVKKTSRPDQGNGSKASGHLPVITSRPPLSTTFDNQSMRSTPLSQGAGQKPISSADTGDSSASDSGNSRSRRSSSAQDSTSAPEVDANFARHDQVSTPVSSASNSDNDVGLGDRLSQGFTAFMSVIEWIVLPPLPPTPSSSSSPPSDSVLPGPRYPRQPPTDQSSSSEASMKPGGGGDRERSTSGKKKLKLRPPRLSRRRYSRAKGAQSKGESNPRLSFSERISQCSPFGRYMPLAILFLLVMTFVCLSLKVPIGRFICYVLACFYTFCVMRHLGILD